MYRRNSRNALNSREPSTRLAPVSSHLFIQKVEKYSNKLELLENSSEGLLAVLLLRDQLQDAISSKDELYPDDALQRLVELDQHLNSIILKTENIKHLSEYRRTFSPAKEHWWWCIDQEASGQEEKKDLLWNVGAVLLVTVSSAFTMEIIKRLWVGTPDTISFFGSALSLALTSSAFTKKGREIGKQILEKIPKLQRTAHAEAKFATSVIAALLVFAIWLFGVPKLAIYYNNKGMKLKNAMPTQAQYYFQRAAALAPEKFPPCYELGRLYEYAGQIDKATIWYEQALERDLKSLGSYNACGRMYILQKKYDSAVLILRAGLRIAEKSSKDSMESDITMLYRYRLLQNLGWAHYARKQYKLAREVLEQAVALEKDATHQVDIDAPVHYFLASAFDQLGNKKMACEHWEIALRYPSDSGFLYKEGWQEIIEERNEDCDQGGWQ